MYNPDDSLCTDSFCEWVEIYNDLSEPVNLENHTLCGSDILSGFVNNSNGALNLNITLRIEPNNFAMITDGGSGTQVYDRFNVSNASVALHVDASSLCGGLSNSGENITLEINGTVALNLTYSNEFANGNGKTLCLFGGTYQECTPTPGAANNAANAAANATVNITDVRLSVYIENATVNQTYASLFKIDIDNKTCASLDNVTVSYNITPSSVTGSFTREVGCSALAVNWTPSAAGNYTICGTATSALNETNPTNNVACKTVSAASPPSSGGCNISISISSGIIFNDTQTIDYRLVTSDTVCAQENSFDIEYWIEDLFGAYAREKTNTTQSMVCSKSIDRQWTPNKISGSEAYKIVANLSPKCSDASAQDNFAERIIALRGSLSAASSPSSTTTSSSSVYPSNVSADQSKKFEVEIVSYPGSVIIDEPFEVVVNLFSPGKKNVSVYSYVFSGSNPVSQGFSEVWKGTWDANKRTVEISANKTEIITLLNKIENGTAPGSYSLRAKVKEEDKDATKSIIVIGRPSLNIETYNGSLAVSASCSECEIMIVGQETGTLSKNYHKLENVSGIFHIFLLRNSKILSKQSVNIPAASIENRTISSNRTVSITAFAAKKGADLGKYVLLIALLSKIKLF